MQYRLIQLQKSIIFSKCCDDSFHGIRKKYRSFLLQNIPVTFLSTTGGQTVSNVCMTCWILVVWGGFLDEVLLFHLPY